MVLLFFSSHAAFYGITRPDQEGTVWKEHQETRRDPFVLFCDLEQRKWAANVFRWSQVISHHTSQSCLQCCWRFCVLLTQATVHSGKAPLPGTFYVFIMRLQLSSANLSDLSILFLNDGMSKKIWNWKLVWYEKSIIATKAGSYLMIFTVCK